MSNLASVKKISVTSTRIASSITLLIILVILCSSILAQLYLFPFNLSNRTDQEGNKAYAAKQFKIRINVDQDPIQRGDTQKITVIVRDANTNNKISNALVRIAVDPHSGKIATGPSHTDDNGETTFKVKISSSADTGTYDVAARASGNGYAAKTVTTSFEVVSNNNDNNDNNDHNNHDHSGDNNNNNNNNNNDQVQVISQSNECGNGKSSSGVNCQNLANQIQGSGNAVNVIGIQSGGGSDDGDGGSTHGHDRNSGGNDGQTGQIGVQQSGSGGGGGGKDGNSGHVHQSQSQAAAQANVCGNGNGASNINCQNLANQIQGSGNAVNIIGSQTDDTKGSNGIRK